MSYPEPDQMPDGRSRARGSIWTQLIESLKFAGRLVGVGLGAGFGVGVVLFILIELTSTEPASGWAALLAVTVIGACMLIGAIAGPLLGLTLLRAMPLAHAILWPTLFAIGGALVDVTVSGLPIVGSLVGLVVGAVALRVVVDSGRQLPGWRAFAGACVALWIGGRIAGYASDRRQVRSILHLSNLPGSVSVVGCESPAFSTDVLTMCVVTLTPADLPKLLAGLSFTEGARPGTTAGMSYATPPARSALGEPFATSTVYSVDLKEGHGGLLRIFVNHTKTRALLDLYIE